MDVVVNFTKSGPDDKPSRATARATAINRCLAEAGFFPNAKRVLLTGQYGRLVFDFPVYMNREGETYKTTSWPHDLPAPSTGCPVQLKIINAIVLE